MLVLVSVCPFDDVACVDGLYYAHKKWCMTAEECEAYGSGYRAYAPAWVCVPALPRESDAMRCADHVCECLGGSRLYLYWEDDTGHAACIADEDTGSDMYPVDGREAYADAHSCGSMLNMYIMRDGDATLCVTRKTCIRRGGFMRDFNGPCLTAAECSRFGDCRNEDGTPRVCYYAYTNIGICVRNVPTRVWTFDQERLREGVYDCGQDYLDLRSFSCVAERACTGTDSAGHRMALFRENRVCMSENQRHTYECYLYEAGGRTELVTAEKCGKILGWHAYYDPRLCLRAAPVQDGGLVQIATYIWGCGYEFVKGWTVDRLLLRLDDAPTCISRAACYFGEPGGILYSTDRNGYIYGYCIPRQGALERYPNQYVTI